MMAVVLPRPQGHAVHCLAVCPSVRRSYSRFQARPRPTDGRATNRPTELAANCMRSWRPFEQGHGVPQDDRHSRGESGEEVEWRDREEEESMERKWQ